MQRRSVVRWPRANGLAVPEERAGRYEKFEHFLPTCILSAVSRLIKVFAALTLALYGLASGHCKLEGLPGFGFLQCCCAAESEPSSPRDCSQDVCGSVESGDYRSEEHSVGSPGPVLVLAVLLPLADEAPVRTVSATESFGPAPPELARFWQFSHRTALPPRAPSLTA